MKSLQNKTAAHIKICPKSLVDYQKKTQKSQTKQMQPEARKQGDRKNLIKKWWLWGGGHEILRPLQEFNWASLEYWKKSRGRLQGTGVTWPE